MSPPERAPGPPPRASPPRLSACSSTKAGSSSTHRWPSTGCRSAHRLRPARRDHAAPPASHVERARPVDNDELEYATGSGLASGPVQALPRGAQPRPDPRAGHELGLRKLRHAARGLRREAGAGRRKDVPRVSAQGPADCIGMRNTIISTDRFGDFILSSQVYTNARDLARLGQRSAERPLSGAVSACCPRRGSSSSAPPAPATAPRLAASTAATSGWCADGMDAVPRGTGCVSTNGNRGQYTIIVPSLNLVIVRRGLDYGRQGFNNWDLTREVVKAVHAHTVIRAGVRCYDDSTCTARPVPLFSPSFSRSPLLPRRSPSTEYRISFPAPEHHYADVEVTFPSASGDARGADEPVLARPLRPSRVLEERVRRQGFDGKGKALTLVRPNPYQWNVAGHDGTVRITYKIFGNHVDGTYLAIDSTHAHMNIPATFMWARGFDLRPIRSRSSSRRDDLEVATQLLPTATVHLHRAELPVLHGQPDRDERLRAPLLQGQDPDGKEFTIVTAVHHDGPDPRSTSTPPAPNRSSRSRARSSASTRSSMPAPTRFSATTSRGRRRRHGTSQQHGGGGAGLVQESARRAAGARHRLARVLSRLERRADPAEIARAVQLRRGQHVGRAVDRRRLHPVLRRARHWGAPAFDRPTDDARSRQQRPRRRHAPGKTVPLRGANEPARAIQRRRALGRRDQLQLRVHQLLHLRQRAGARPGSRAARAIGRQALARRLHAGVVEGPRQAGGSPPGLVAEPYTLQDARDRLAEVSGDQQFADEFFARMSKVARRPTTPLLAPAGIVVRKQNPGAPWTGLQMDRRTRRGRRPGCVRDPGVRRRARGARPDRVGGRTSRSPSSARAEGAQAGRPLAIVLRRPSGEVSRRR